MDRRQQIERAQHLCAALFAGQPERSLVDELITERRADAAGDDAEAAKRAVQHGVSPA